MNFNCPKCGVTSMGMDGPACVQCGFVAPDYSTIREKLLVEQREANRRRNEALGLTGNEESISK